MYFLNQILENLHNFYFQTFDYITLTINAVLFLFAKQLIVRTDSLGKTDKDYSLKVKLLRTGSIAFFLIFAIGVLFGKNIGIDWGQTYLTFIFAYVINHWVTHFILIKYGDHETVDDVQRYTDNYVSQIMKIIVGASTVIIAVSTLIHIWELKSWLESGSALVTIGFIIFATKDYWLEEVLSSLTIHAKSRLKRGSVIQLEDGKVFIVLETNFIGTRLKNQLTDIETIVPNKTFVRDRFKLLSIDKNSDSNEKSKKKEFKAIKQYIRLNIGYETSYETVEEYFKLVMEESSKALSSIGTYSLNLVSNGDHAVTWEILYYLNSPYHVKKAHDTINLIAFKNQKDFGIDLSTPITYLKV